MVKEDCTYEEAVQRYNQYLFDPDGYSIIKMNEQIREAGFNRTRSTSAEKGQEGLGQAAGGPRGGQAAEAEHRSSWSGRCWLR